MNIPAAIGSNDWFHLDQEAAENQGGIANSNCVGFKLPLAPSSIRTLGWTVSDAVEFSTELFPASLSNESWSLLECAHSRLKGT